MPVEFDWEVSFDWRFPRLYGDKSIADYIARPGKQAISATLLWWIAPVSATEETPDKSRHRSQ